MRSHCIKIANVLAVTLLIYSSCISFIASVPNAQAASCLPQPPNLVSWWPADWTPNDQKSANDATLINGAMYGSGEASAGFCSDGSDDRIEVADNANLQFSTALTFAAWVQVDDLTTYEPIIEKHRCTSGQWGPQLDLNPVSGGLNLVMQVPQVGGGGCGSVFAARTTTSVAVADHGFHFVAGTYQGSGTNQIHLYVDGAEVTTTSSGSAISIPSTINTNSQPLRIGNDISLGGSFVDHFHGIIDEPQVYSRALTASEIAAQYTAGRAGMCKQTGCVPTSGGLVSWWPGEGNAQDYAGTNNGTMTNGASFNTGKVGQAFSLDGSDDYVSLGNVTTPNNVSISAWIYPTGFGSGGANNIWAASDSAGNSVAAFKIDGSGTILDWDIYNGGGTSRRAWSTSFSFSTNQWYHVVVTQNGGPSATPHIYINGVDKSVSSLISNGGVPTNTNLPASIGRLGDYPTQYYFGGQIDEVQLFSRALSTTEVQNIYNAGRYGSCKTNAPFQVTTMSDTLSREQVSAAANHTLVFTTPLAINPGQILSYRIPTGFSIPSAMDFTDVDVSYGPSTGAENELTLAASPSGSTWGTKFQCGTLLLTSGTGVIPAGSKIIIEMGTNATTGATGDQQITNPTSVGTYAGEIQISNSEVGAVSIPVPDSDQVNESGSTSTSLTFDLDTATTDTESAPPYDVTLGTLSSSTLSTSRTDGVGTVKALFFDLTTNANAGATITMKGANGGLHSVSASKTIGLSLNEDTISAGQEKMGVCVSSTSASTGTLAAAANYDADGASNCTSTNSGTPRVGKIQTTPAIILNTSGAAISGGRAALLLKASVSSTTQAATDYSETLTFIATGTF